jgi:DNA-binding XRE family transcriptional regulator
VKVASRTLKPCQRPLALFEDRKYIMARSLTFKVAQRISHLGNQQHHTVKTLAVKSDLSPSTVYNILNTDIIPYNPTLRTLEKLAKGLRTPLGELLTFGKKRTIAAAAA